MSYINILITLGQKEELNILDLYLIKDCKDLLVVKYFLESKNYNYIGCIGKDNFNHDLYKFSNGFDWLEYCTYSYKDTIGCEYDFTYIEYYIADENKYIDLIKTLKILSFELYEDITDSEGTPMQLWTILDISNVFGPFRMIKILRKGTIHIVTIVA
jgi:hypothetical protein